MKLIQLERRQQISKQAFEKECKSDRKLKRLRRIENGLFWLLVLTLIMFVYKLTFFWLSGSISTYILNFLIIILIHKRRKRLKQPYIFLKN